VKYRVLCIGRRARDPLLDAADDYLARLQHYCGTTLVRLREGTMASEAGELLGRITPRDHVVVLDERGKQHSTYDLQGRVTAWQALGLKDLAFVIGGADGLHPEVKARAQERWALSRLTLPHRFAQALLLEQLYRVHTLLRGEQYHRP
jgi:23S rRNA (pseudouridine1915-N3)-methyltransferase